MEIKNKIVFPRIIKHGEVVFRDRRIVEVNGFNVKGSLPQLFDYAQSHYIFIPWPIFYRCPRRLGLLMGMIVFVTGTLNVSVAYGIGYGWGWKPYLFTIILGGLALIGIGYKNILVNYFGAEQEG